MIKVKFNAVSEFLEELERDAAEGHIFRQTVRVTNQFATSSFSPAVKHVSVLSTYLVNHPRGMQLVQLRRDVGDVWGQTEQDKKTFDRAEGIQQEITKAAVAHDLMVLAGEYELIALRTQPPQQLVPGEIPTM